MNRLSDIFRFLQNYFHLPLVKDGAYFVQCSHGGYFATTGFIFTRHKKLFSVKIGSMKYLNFMLA